jgi:ATP-binding cassette, subfamily B, bacterial
VTTTDRPADTEPADTELAELALAPWRVHDQRVISAGLCSMVRALPGCLRLIGELAWRASPAACITTVVLQLVAAAIAAFGLLATADALSTLLAAGPTPQRLVDALPTIVLVAGAYATRALAESAVAAANARLSPSVHRLAEDRLVAMASRVELAAFDDPDFYDTMSRARDQGVPNVERALDHAVELAGSLVSLAAVATTVAVLNPVLLPVLVLSVLPQGWSTLRSARMGYAAMVAWWDTNRRIWMISDLLADRNAAAEIRAFTAQPFLLGRYRQLTTALERSQIRLGLAQTGTQLVGRALSGVGTVAAYATLGVLLYVGATPLAVAGAAVVAIQSGRSQLSRAVLAVNRLYEQNLYVMDYAAFLTGAADRIRTAGRTTAPRDPRVITVEGVSFGYPGQDGPAVAGVSLTIRRGEVLALVGENGSGKSTLAKLLAGLYTPQAGRVRWDRVDLADADLDSVRDRVAVVLQDPVRWPLTARHNVTIGRPDHPDLNGDRLDRVAAAASADTVVAELPYGWDTLLSKKFVNGHDLSVGQWQRVGVARALYRDAPLLICDEPTAALDARAEAAVYESLQRLAAGRTVVLITHRLASVRHADQIAVLHRGRLIEHGNHDQLMTLGGHYAELYTLQARAYQDGAAVEWSATAH